MNTLKKKTASERLRTALKKAPRRGLTVTELAARTELERSTVSRILATSDFAQVIGVQQTGRRGRPANIFALAA